MTQIYELFTHISKDLTEPAKYLPWGILNGIILLLLREALYKITSLKPKHDMAISRRIRKSSGTALFLAAAYLTTLLILAFFSREPGSRNSLDLILFSTWGPSAVLRAYFIENIIMFIPFGILAPLVIRKARQGRWCITGGFLFSVCLELMQLATQRGYCQIDDIVTNTAGTAIGWSLYYLYNALLKKTS